MAIERVPLSLPGSKTNLKTNELIALGIPEVFARRTEYLDSFFETLSGFAQDTKNAYAKEMVTIGIGSGLYKPPS